MVPVHILRLFFIKVNNKIITAEGNQGNAPYAEETPPKLSLPDTTPTALKKVTVVHWSLLISTYNKQLI